MREKGLISLGSDDVESGDLVRLRILPHILRLELAEDFVIGDSGEGDLYRLREGEAVSGALQKPTQSCLAHAWHAHWQED